MKMRTILVSVAAVSAGALSLASFAEDQAVEYPADYRDWTHVKSMLISEGHPLYDAFGGLHHLYANEEAMQGYAEGEFPDGSVIAFDLLEAVNKDNAIVEGSRKVLGVMVKDADRFASTGGWGFEAFAGGDPSQPVVDDAATACYGCHTSRAEHDYVFSSYRE